MDEPIGEFEEQVDIAPRGPYLPKFVAPEARILIVDDNRMNLNVIVGLLQVTQVQVLTASSGEECLQTIREKKVDMVLLDHMMPGIGGVETLKRLRESGYKNPVIALTANYFQDAEEVYSSFGFNGYLPKPVNSEELETIIINNLPAEKVILQADTYHVGTHEEDIPEDMQWLRNVSSIDLREGLKNSGGAIPFAYSIKFFYETIEDNVDVLEKAYADRDLRLYVIKVHGLKTSAKIIGAMKLYEMAKDLEKAGKNDDIAYIDDNHNLLIEEYRSFTDSLSGVMNANLEGDVTKVSRNITSEELKAAYKAIFEYTQQMDFDALEQIIGKLDEYRLPSDDKKIMDDIERALKKYEWKTIQELTKSRDDE
ncbi:MAG: response regulator [Butyrivibrio sp.]|nr:response regulator [Butyrivibrio sp.]